MITRCEFLRVDRARLWDVRQKADPANCRRGNAPTWNGMNVALNVNALHLGDSSPWGRLSWRPLCLSPPTMRMPLLR
jgi:hypothetical protein